MKNDLVNAVQCAKIIRNKLNDEDYEELISSVSMWIKESDPNNEFVRLEWI